MGLITQVDMDKPGFFQFMGQRVFLPALKYMFGYTKHDFAWYCKLWWLGLVTIWLLPFFFVFKEIIGRPLIWLCKRIEKYADDHEEQWARERWERYKNDPEWKKKVASLCSKEYQRFYKKAWNMIESQDLNDLDTERANVKREKYLREQRKQNESLIKRHQNSIKINKILKYAKPVGQVILGIVGVAALAGLGWLVYKLVIALMHVDHAQWVKVLHFLLWVIAIVGGFFLLIILGAYLDENLSCEFRSKWKSFWRAVFSPFRWFFYGIRDGVSFIYQMIAGSCPSIKW